jgi:8-oxo-dGTP pyrophosphatase MutT (NUDIX family)
VLLRDASDGLEVLLLRRSARAGFVPDMYVFPGGRVDASDADPALAALLDGLTPEAAAARLGLTAADPPAIAYYLAALREAFEETGILVGHLRDGSVPPTAAEDATVDSIRDDLMEDRITFLEAAARLECRFAGHALEYFAHWITPQRQPRRFDTRFFAARVGTGRESIIDPREMTDARWLTPAAALAEHELGEMPMILPTVSTLEKLQGFRGTAEALMTLSRETVVTILPGG